jgi:hypothetical protein
MLTHHNTPAAALRLSFLFVSPFSLSPSVCLPFLLSLGCPADLLCYTVAPYHTMHAWHDAIRQQRHPTAVAICIRISVTPWQHHRDGTHPHAHQSQIRPVRPARLAVSRLSSLISCLLSSFLSSRILLKAQADHRQPPTVIPNAARRARRSEWTHSNEHYHAALHVHHLASLAIELQTCPPAFPSPPLRTNAARKHTSTALQSTGIRQGTT